MSWLTWVPLAVPTCDIIHRLMSGNQMEVIMKFARFQVGGKTGYGILDGDTLREISGVPLKPYHETGASHPLRQVRLLAPLEPRKALAVGLNYGSHVPEATQKRPQEPQGFWKSVSALIGPEKPIVLPRDAGRVDAEGELVVVMGRRARNVRKEEALEYVFGYTCGNDVSARVWQRGDLQWWRAKSSDTFGPFGPWVVTHLDPAALELVVRINGTEVQRSDTSEMIFDVPTLISFFSRWVTLEPGDLVFTGTPGRPGELHPGDVVEVEISNIGVLRNPVSGEE